MRRPRREPWSFWCILKCSVREPMRSLSNAICTSGLPVSVACVPYWSITVFFCSLASTSLVHSCLIFQLFCNVIEVNTLVGGCKDEEVHHRDTESQSELSFFWMRLYLGGLGRISSFSNSFTTSSTTSLMTRWAELGSKVSLVPVQMRVLPVGVTA